MENGSVRLSHATCTSASRARTAARRCSCSGYARCDAIELLPGSSRCSSAPPPLPSSAVPLAAARGDARLTAPAVASAVALPLCTSMAVVAAASMGAALAAAAAAAACAAAVAAILS